MKHDPRVEPASDDPSGQDLTVDHVSPDARLPLAPVEGAQPQASPAAGGERSVRRVTSPDPRLEPLEALLDKNDWRRIYAELGAADAVGALPPNLGLVAALAASEVAKEGDPAAARVAIRCMAAVLGVAEESPMARVLARRLLRKNPVRLAERAAPPARTSLLIVVLALLLGGGVGLFASGTSPLELLRMLGVP